MENKENLEKLALNNLDFSQNLFVLKTVYAKIVNILDVFCMGYFTIRNERLNYYYTSFQSIVNEILASDGFEKIAKDLPQLFNSLIGDVKDMDIEWEITGRDQAYEFLGKIERLYIENGSKKYKMPGIIEASFEKIDVDIKAHMDEDTELWNRIGNEKLTLNLDYNVMTRDIKLNNVLVARPNFDSPNHSIFEFLYQNESKIFTKKDLENALKMGKLKDFNVFLNEINLKGIIRKYLFVISKNKIGFRNKVEVIDKNDILKISSELAQLQKIGIGRN